MELKYHSTPSRAESDNTTDGGHCNIRRTVSRNETLTLSNSYAAMPAVTRCSRRARLQMRRVLRQAACTFESLLRTNHNIIRYTAMVHKQEHGLFPRSGQCLPILFDVAHRFMVDFLNHVALAEARCRCVA